jgi:hypothetical protein
VKSEKMIIYKSGNRLSPDAKFVATLILNFLVSRTTGNIAVVEATHSVVWDCNISTRLK